MRYKYFTKSYNSKNKKIILILALLIISCMFAFSVYAQDDIVEGVSDLYFEVYSQLDDLDLSELDSIFKDVDGEDVFKIDFSSLIKQIIEGNIDLDAESLLGYFLKILFYNISKLLPTLLLILIVAVILKCLECFSPNLFKDGLFDVINFVAIGIVVIILSNMIIGINDVVYSAIETMQNIINLWVYLILYFLFG